MVLYTEPEPSFRQKVESVIEGKKVTTSINLSREACVALYFLLRDELNIEDMVEFEKSSGQDIFNKTRK